jgi:hypothetical protein
MTAITQQATSAISPIESRAAWEAGQLISDRSWIQLLTSEQVEALDRALDRVREQRLPLFKFDRKAVADPILEELGTQCAHELDRGRGLVMLRGLPVDRYDDEALYLIYWILAVYLGDPIVQNARGELLGEVRDRGYDYGANNVRGYNTKAELRPHCDPADVVSLLCVSPARSGGESRVVSAVAIYNAIAAETPELIPPLMNGFHFDLRGEGVTENPDETTFHRVPVFSLFDGQLSCRFNVKTLTDGMRKAGVEMTELERRAVGRVSELATDERFVLPMTFERGDIQLLCNHSILHARSDFEDYEDPDKKRRLLRVWMNLRDGRELDDRFSDRFNTGPRNGIRVQEGADYWVR